MVFTFSIYCTTQCVEMLNNSPGVNKENFKTKYFLHSSIMSYMFLPADSVEEAQKWLTGLELLRQETLAAPTPVLIER